MGWIVDYYGIGDLVEEINKVLDVDVDKEYVDLEFWYEMV